VKKKSFFRMQKAHVLSFVGFKFPKLKRKTEKKGFFQQTFSTDIKKYLQKNIFFYIVFDFSFVSSLT